MFKIMGLTLLLILPNYVKAGVELSALLAISPGNKPLKTIPPKGNSAEFSYEITLKEEQVESVRIDFNQPVPSEQHINPNVQGNCLTQLPSGSVFLPRFYFFDVSKHLRYELTPEKKIISILIQNIPGAKKNRSCSFKGFDPSKDLKPKVRKLK